MQMPIKQIVIAMVWVIFVKKRIVTTILFLMVSIIVPMWIIKIKKMKMEMETRMIEKEASKTPA